MVSSLNFIIVIAVICHIEGDVHVDKYLYAYKPQKKTMKVGPKQTKRGYFAGFYLFIC